MYNIVGSIKGLLSVITEKYDLQYYIYKKQIMKERRNQQKKKYFALSYKRFVQDFFSKVSNKML